VYKNLFLLSSENLRSPLPYDPSAQVCYRSRKAEKDAPVLARMRELAGQYPRLTVTGVSASFSAETVTR
jgi:hypothetical protein